jgi:hypothetical protein
MISTYIIIDATLPDANQYMGKVQAGNGKVALQKFIQSNCMSAGMYDIHKSKFGWEMTNQYGSRFCAIKGI